MKSGRDYLLLARRHLWIVLAAALIAGVTVYALTSGIRPTYQATAKVLINASQSTSTGTTNASPGQQLMRSYSSMAVDPIVLQQAIMDAKLPYRLDVFQQMVTAKAEKNTQLIDVTGKAHTGAEAQLIADIVARTFISQQRGRLPSGATWDAMTLVQPAIVRLRPISPRPTRDSVLGMLGGSLVATCFIVVRALLDDTIKSRRDVETKLQLPVAGLMPINSGATTLLTTRGIAQSQQSAEVYRVIRANLQLTTGDTNGHVILVTSTQKGEGKTTIACGLAIALAEAGKRVILVDGDLRVPSVHHAFEVENQVGLTNLFVTRDGLPQDYLQPTALQTLYLLTSGMEPPMAADLLDSERMAALLLGLRQLADVVIIDSPPVLAVADAVILSSMVQGILLVIASGGTRLPRVLDAISMLRRRSTPILGVVLNKVSRDVDSYDRDGSTAAYMPASSVGDHQ